MLIIPSPWPLVTALWIISIVIGALGTVPVELIKGLKAPEMACALGLLQKACLLGSARILRKILDTQGGLIWKRKRFKPGNVQRLVVCVPLQMLWASVAFHQWSYKYVEKLQGLHTTCLKEKINTQKNFVERGWLCTQPRRNRRWSLSRADNWCQAEKSGVSPGASVAHFPCRA